MPKALRDRGASFNGTTYVDRTNYFETLPATDDNLEFAIRFEADRLVNSFVRREDLLSEMTVVRNEFERGENSPDNLLGKRMMAAAFEWHNYGKSTIGNRSDIERVPIDNLQDFYRSYYQPDNVVLIVAGKFDEAEGARLRAEVLRRDPAPERKLNNDLHRRAAAGRRAEGRAAARRRRRPRGRGLSHAGRRARRLSPRSKCCERSWPIAPRAGSTRRWSKPRRPATSRRASIHDHDPGVFDVLVEVRKDGSLDEAARHHAGRRSTRSSPTG